uniref:Uncharacterized protein n=1 Tax=Rhizophora mucronata TaxID=61149 RepID=A0A2P2NN80_RHIMU
MDDKITLVVYKVDPLLWAGHLQLKVLDLGRDSFICDNPIVCFRWQPKILYEDLRPAISFVKGCL